ncbi:hypothetical protein GE09DRAFT_1082613 [Coniochaeta sp. 2T2.1]|nr:hypothetical protein GE09DRAFT_1082613 [Coniochaeta sp. 2T2.1]
MGRISQRDSGEASPATTPVRQLDSLPSDQGLATCVHAAQQPADISPIPAQAAPHNLSSSALDIALGQASLAHPPTNPASPSPNPLRSPFLAHYHKTTLYRSRPSFQKSPFFIPSPSPSKRPRPTRGTISSLPFPPLSSPRFGLIQETLTHDPFRLLIAVTFLIKTTGRAAIPVFHRVMERFPTPEAFLEEEEGDLEGKLLPMIEKLGLGVVRCRVIGRYARGWVERAPERGRRWRVGGYPRMPVREEGGEDDQGGSGKEEVPREDDEDEVKREVMGEVEQSDGVGENLEASDDVKAESETPKKKKRRKSKLPSSEWEIGHLTQGRYAIDSWRIFCRDIFLGKSDNWMGRSQDWTGETVEEEEQMDFEPEWKRVLPEDKELRACLRWMWMREGFEWDPVTGRRGPLREEMRLAVEEGRVKYDEKGELVIVEEGLDGGGMGVRDVTLR